jgi:hypothetical protein
LRARPERDPLAARAERAAEQLAPLAASPRLEGRFLVGLRGLAEALRGLAAMRACEFAPELVRRAQTPLEDALVAAEQALRAARSELETERRSLRSHPAGAGEQPRRAK